MIIYFNDIIFGILLAVGILVVIFAVKFGRIRLRKSAGLAKLKTGTMVQLSSYHHDINKEIFDVKQYYFEKSQGLDLNSHKYLVHPANDNGILLEVVHHVWIEDQVLMLFPSKDMLSNYYTLQFNGIVLTRLDLENIKQVKQNLDKHVTELVVLNDINLPISYLFELNDYYVFEKLFQSYKLESLLQ